MNMNNVDTLISEFDKTLRILGGILTGTRTNPALHVADGSLDEKERRHSAGLMRVDHVGEVCAQALYEAQGRFAKTPALKEQFAQAAREEEDHLAWTAQRLRDLGSHPSLLNPLWYLGAYMLGALAARSGDAASLGFVVETERQVEAHLDSHLKELPLQDAKSRAIVAQMRDDEVAHGAAAAAMGASEMPAPVREIMRGLAKVMTKSAYFL